MKDVVYGLHPCLIEVAQDTRLQRQVHIEGAFSVPGILHGLPNKERRINERSRPLLKVVARSMWSFERAIHRNHASFPEFRVRGGWFLVLWTSIFKTLDTPTWDC